MSQKGAAFFLSFDDNHQSSQSFNQSLQQKVKELRQQLLSIENIVAISTKSWKSYNTSVIIAHLDRNVNDLDVSSISKANSIFLKAVASDSDMMRNKPKCMIGIFNILDDKQNNMEINGKEIFVCVQQSNVKRNEISALRCPSNTINPTKRNDYQHNTSQTVSEGIDNMKID
eukprot:201049_1